MAYRKSYNKNYTKKPIVKEPRKIFNWSSVQKAIFEDVACGAGNTQVIARAGTGKTTVITESFYHIPKGKTSLMIAFNKPIQLELERRAPFGVDVLTCHALGLKACKKAFPNLAKNRNAIDNKKLPGYVKALVGDENNYELRTSLEKTVSLCKGCLAFSNTEIDDVMTHYQIDTNSMTRDQFIDSVIVLLKACKEDTNRIDFDDMIWFAVIFDLDVPKYDFVFIDEAQDLNKSQIELALKSCKSDGRIISVGDPSQSIYQFRGADSEAIDNIIKRCNSKTLPLNITYRCGKQIVALAKEYVEDFEAGENNEEGLVEYVNYTFMEQNVKPGDFVLSRTNAPLIKWCLRLLKGGIPANIQGRDLGKNLLSIIKKSKAENVNSFLEYLYNWAEIERERLIKNKKDTGIIDDKVECFEVLCEGTHSLQDVSNNIDKLFYDGDDKSRVIFSTTHKAKGLERDRVFVLQDTYRPGKTQEETNLMYVAITRAKNELYMVHK